MSISQIDSKLQEISSKIGSSLDLFSTSQENALSSQTWDALSSYVPCENGAPFFAYQLAGKSYAVMQGNCHSWSCPRCGINRAKQEYGRIVEGCRTLAIDHDLYFITITCRGKEMSLEAAEAGYLKWTNKLLTSMRYQSKKRHGFWHYMQVTERQKRGHPHSHIITTYKPHDLRDGFKDNWTTESGQIVNVPKVALRSDWLQKRVISAGLGSQYDISKVDSVEGASRYVAKYMFKDSMFETTWAKNWRRVRYSQSFPKLEKKSGDAFVLLKKEDWLKLASLAVVVKPSDPASYEESLSMLRGHDVIVNTTRLENMK